MTDPPPTNCPAVLAAPGTTADYIDRGIDGTAKEYFSKTVIAWSHYGEPLVDDGTGVLVSAVQQFADIDNLDLMQINVPAPR